MSNKPTRPDAKKVQLRENDVPIEGPVLVAFDFDGTLTTKDSFLSLLAWRAGPVRYALGMVRLAPAALAYLHHRDRARIKAAAVREYLGGVSRETLEDDARRFAQQFAPKLLRPDALATWRRWQGRGARMIIVTASPDLTVAPFARGLGAEVLIGTQLAFDDKGRVTGALAGANCRAAEKVRRLQAMFGEDVRLAAAYGDTPGDLDMMQIADERGYQVFNARPQ